MNKLSLYYMIVIFFMVTEGVYSTKITNNSNSILQLNQTFKQEIYFDYSTDYNQWSTKVYEVEDDLSFTILYENYNNKVDVTVVNIDEDPNVRGKEYKFSINANSLSLDGNHKNCKMFVDYMNFQVTLFKLNETLGQFEMIANLTENLAITNINQYGYMQSGNLLVSQNCRRFAYTDIIWNWEDSSDSFVLGSPLNSTFNFNFSASTGVDKNLNYFMHEQDIFVYNQTNKNFQRFMNVTSYGSNSTYYGMMNIQTSRLYSYEDRIIFYSKKKDLETIFVEAFTFDQISFESFFSKNFTDNSTNYTNTQVKVSPKLTKILLSWEKGNMYGSSNMSNTTSNVSSSELYHLDFDNKIYTEISLPQRYYQNAKIALEENMIYILSLNQNIINNSYYYINNTVWTESLIIINENLSLTVHQEDMVKTNSELSIWISQNQVNNTKEFVEGVKFIKTSNGIYYALASFNQTRYLKKTMKIFKMAEISVNETGNQTNTSQSDESLKQEIYFDYSTDYNQWSTKVYEVEDDLSFTILYENYNNKVDVTVVNIDEDPNVRGKEYKFSINANSLSLDGNHKNCKMFVDYMNFQVTLFKLNETLGQFEMIANLTENLAITNINQYGYMQSGNLLVSQNCRRFAYTDIIWNWEDSSDSFVLGSPLNSTFNFNFSASTGVDKNLNYFMHEQDIFVYNQTNKNFQRFMNVTSYGSNSTYYGMMNIQTSRLYSYEDRIIFYSKKKDLETIFVEAFTFDQISFESFFSKNFTDNSTNYTNTQVKVSPKLTKILLSWEKGNMYGSSNMSNTTSNVSSSELYHLDFDNKIYTEISLPQRYYQNAKIALEENMIYILSLNQNIINNSYYYINNTVWTESLIIINENLSLTVHQEDMVKTNSELSIWISQNQVNNTKEFVEGVKFIKTSNGIYYALASFNQTRYLKKTMKIFKMAEISVNETGNQTNTSQSDESLKQEIYFDYSTDYNQWSTKVYEVEDDLSFTILYENYNNKVDVTVVNIDEDPNVRGKEYKFSINANSLSLDGNHKNCKMFVDYMNFQVTLFKLNETLGQFEMIANLTENLAITNINQYGYMQSGNLLVSQNCRRFAYTDIIWNWEDSSDSFVLGSPLNSTFNFNFSASTGVDKNLNYFMHEQDIFVYNQTNKNFQRFMNVTSYGSNSTYYGMMNIQTSRLYSYEDRIIFYSKKKDLETIFVEAFTFDQISFESFFSKNFTDNSTNYTNTQVKVSPKLTKILLSWEKGNMYGSSNMSNTTSNVSSSELYHLDFDNKIYTEISLPQRYYQNAKIALEENMIYILSLNQNIINNSYYYINNTVWTESLIIINENLSLTVHQEDMVKTNSELSIWISQNQVNNTKEFVEGVKFIKTSNGIYYALASFNQTRYLKKTMKIFKMAEISVNVGEQNQTFGNNTYGMNETDSNYTNSTNFTQGNYSNSTNFTQGNSTNVTESNSTEMNYTMNSSSNITNTTINNTITVKNITFEDPPIVNQTIKASIDLDSAGSYIEQAENLQIMKVQNTQEVKFYQYKRSANNSLQEWSKNSSTGQFETFLQGTVKDRSCNLFKNSVNGQACLVMFDPLASEPINIFSSIVFSSDNTTWITNVSNFSNIKTGTNCNFLALDQNIFTFNSSSSKLSKLTLPSGWDLQANTQSFKYVISNKKLYKYFETYNIFEVIYDIGQNYNYFDIHHFEERIVVLAEERIGSRNVSSGINNTNTTFYASNFKLLIFSDDKFQLLDSHTFSGETSDEDGAKLFASPQLTKIAFVYQQTDSALKQFVFKSVNYISKTVYNLTFEEQGQFLDLVEHLDHKKGAVVGDNYFIFKNLTGYFVNSTLQIHEKAYQVVGTKIIEIRTRIISVNDSQNEAVNLDKMWIDTNFKTQMVLLQVYNNGSTKNKNYREYKLGNIQTNRKAKKPDPTPDFQHNTFVSLLNKKIEDKLSWTFINDDGNKTQVQSLNIEFSPLLTPSNFTFNISGSWFLFEHQPQCKFFYDQVNTKQIWMYSLDKTTNQFTLKENITNIIMQNETFFDYDRFYVSQDCSRINYKNKFWYWNTTFQQFTAVNFNLTLNVSTISKDMSYILNNNASSFELYFFNPTTNRYTFVRNTTAALDWHKIFNFNDRIMIRSQNKINGGENVEVYHKNQNGTDLIFERKSWDNVTSEMAQTKISPDLTKIIIYGFRTINSNQSFSEMYHINYNNDTSTPITFNELNLTLLDPSQYEIQLSNNILLFITSTNSLYSQKVYYINSYLEVILERQSTFSNATGSPTYSSSEIIINSQGTIYIYRLYNVTNSHIQLWKAGEFNFNIVKDPTLATQMINGQVKVCDPGCSSCTDGVCASCSLGFTLSVLTSNCDRCESDCQKCETSDPSVCQTCVEGFYLEGISCVKCHEGCIECTGPAACIQCPPGQYPSSSGTSCLNCSLNCQVCSSNGTCQICNSGFALNSTQNKCMSCFMTCSDCDPSDITVCTACTTGLYLSNDVCEQCSERCLECSNASNCEQCISGYHTNSNGICILDCQFPCLQCQQNQPTVCTECYYGTNLINNECQIDLSCNQDYSCDYCGVGFNYILIAGQCMQCNKIQNCLQASAANCDICTKCQDGFYFNGQYCASCQPQCLDCSSNDTCTSCIEGYYLPRRIKEGQCRACRSPCKTCQKTPRRCLECQDGFTKRGWKCRKNRNVGFVIVFIATEVELKPYLIYIIQIILASIFQNDVSVVYYIQITSGSVVLNGTAEPTVLSQEDASTNIAQAINGLNAGNITVGSSSVVINGDEVNSQGGEDSQGGGMMPIIAGAAGGIVIIVVIVAVYCYRRRKSVELATVHVQPAETDEVIDDPKDLYIKPIHQDSMMIIPQASRDNGFAVEEFE